MTTACRSIEELAGELDADAIYAFITGLISQYAETLLLQAKQASRSVLADFLNQSEYDNQGQRVVIGQRLMQAASDIFLGWLRSAPPGRPAADYYVRQLRDGSTPSRSNGSTRSP